MALQEIGRIGAGAQKNSCLLYTSAKEVGFDAVQMIQDDKNRWALYIKPENKEGYSVYPDKADVNRFFSTLKQAMDNIDKVRMELAHKYYALADVYKRQDADHRTPVDERGSESHDRPATGVQPVSYTHL